MSDDVKIVKPDAPRDVVSQQGPLPTQAMRDELSNALKKGWASAAGTSPATPRIRPPRTEKNLRHALDYFWMDHRAPCDDPHCDSVYCFAADVMGDELRRSVATTPARRSGALPQEEP